MALKSQLTALGAMMMYELYDRVLLKDGHEASIVEVFDDGWFIADIDKNGETYTEETSIGEIERKI